MKDTIRTNYCVFHCVYAQLYSAVLIFIVKTSFTIRRIIVVSSFVTPNSVLVLAITLTVISMFTVICTISAKNTFGQGQGVSEQSVNNAKKVVDKKGKIL